MLIDTHAHINFNAYKNDAEEVLRRSLEAGVFVVNVGSQYSTSKRAVEMAHKFEGVYAAIGLHPIQLKTQTIQYQNNWEIESQEIKTTGEEFEEKKYLELAKDEKVVAIGEVGLDYHHFEEGDDIKKLQAKQKEVLGQFIKLANEARKPLIIHCWDAYDDLHEILKNSSVEKKGVIHSFSGSYKTAKKFNELGYKIGLSGVVTYGISYDRLIREVALENIVLETDCPYLNPKPLPRNNRNEPQNVKFIAEKIAQIKQISIKEVEEVTTRNAKDIFSIKNF